MKKGRSWMIKQDIWQLNEELNAITCINNA